MSRSDRVPIETWVPRAKVSEADFVAAYPHAVLVHPGDARPLQSVPGSPSATIDRLVLERMTISRPANRSPYDVFALIPRGGRRVSIGCDPACDVVVDDGSLSKVHAYVEKVGVEWRITDNDSSAGTRVNEQLLDPATPFTLTGGDRVTLGFVDLIFLAPGDFWRLVRAIG